MFRGITLELSLKPFKKTDREYIEGVCKQIFSHWAPLLKGRDTVSVMLWTSDGSELLDYAGREEDTFEWCRFVGTANLPYPAADEPDYLSLHKRKHDYMENAPVMTYAILKTIVSCIKEAGARHCPWAKIRVGETFDIGPEFAISDFKYNRHTEICVTTSVVDKFGFVDATALLKGDDRPYAAYPKGIPDGTPFGTFLGKQASVFLKDMGFDYLWLSNGLGFSADPWKKTGKIFDGERYYPEKLKETKRKVFDFWRLFREACPDIPLETRGTNNSVGIDYASDGVPLHDIYDAALNITAPPNSPWAAINDNYGLELMGHMTRVCELPKDNDTFPFRYYLHDPWWVNSPWYDRYDGTPCDLYLPMALSRVTEEGRVETANTLNILSIDNSYGDMPDACVNESIPHFLKAEKDAPDAPAPVVWVYPMREYTTSADETLLREMNLGDRYICDAINDGFPLSTVVSTHYFLRHTADLYRASILLTPVPETVALGEKLAEMAAAGIPVLVYGTEERLSRVKKKKGMTLLSTEGSPSLLRETLASFGYEIGFSKRSESKNPALVVYRADNALFFSAYNPNTTTEIALRFPLGTPILCGMETELREGMAHYRFARSEHRECRVMIEQKEGVVSCRERAPVSAYFRRAIKLTGLSDATVRFFGERGCEMSASISPSTDCDPVFPQNMTVVEDGVNPPYLEIKHVNGQIFLLMGHINKK